MIQKSWKALEALSKDIDSAAAQCKCFAGTPVCISKFSCGFVPPRITGVNSSTQILPKQITSISVHYWSTSNPHHPLLPWGENQHHRHLENLFHPSLVKLKQSVRHEILTANGYRFSMKSLIGSHFDHSVGVENWQVSTKQSPRVDWFHNTLIVTWDTRSQTTYMDFLAATLIITLLPAKFGFLQSQPSRWPYPRLNWVALSFLHRH